MTLRIIGLTGGIATGKSTAAEILWRQHGVTLVDADLLARAAVEPGQPALAAITARYGARILRPDGQLDRPQLGEIIFADPAERAWLEGQIHPWVAAQTAAEIAAARSAGEGVIVLVVPLLFEAGLTDWVTEIWLVVCSEAQQRDRLMTRNGLTAAAADARIASQWPLAAKRAQAQVILDNSGSPMDLEMQIAHAWRSGWQSSKQGRAIG